MPVVNLDGTSIYYEDSGSGMPILWCHEYFGDYRSWAPQLEAFGSTHRNIVYSARGFFRSSAPDDASSYSQDLMIEDLRGLLEHLKIDRAIIVGLSMGANVAVNFGMRYPDRCLGLVIAGCGSGSTQRDVFEEKAVRMIQQIEQDGMAGLQGFIELDDTRIDFHRKRPMDFDAFLERLQDRSPAAAIHVYREVQIKRPGILSLTDGLKQLPTPSLVMFGDRDAACVDPGIHLWREIDDARLSVFPATGHCLNLEEPELFNAIVRNFVSEL